MICACAAVCAAAAACKLSASSKFATHMQRYCSVQSATLQGKNTTATAASYQSVLLMLAVCVCRKRFSSRATNFVLFLPTATDELHSSNQRFYELLIPYYDIPSGSTKRYLASRASLLQS
jgi:hypothetical protein